MACAHPLTFHPHVRLGSHFFGYPKPVKVPCGYCVNCRRDYQNYICDRAEYEYCKRLTASFVTVTYDDIHLIEQCAVTNQFGLIYEDDDKRQVRTSLNYKNVRNFLHAVRERVHEHYEKQREKDPNYKNVLMQEDFSYMYCGEYGDLYGRCHFHILFFGLDFAACAKMFRSVWKFGICDVLPLLDGGIRYVTKYMDKMEKGDLAFYNYDCKCMARPKLVCSRGFGQDLLWDNAKDIFENAFTYRIAKGKRRPISAYWKFLLTGYCTSRDPTKKDYFHKTDYYIALRREQTAERMRAYNLHHKVNVYDEKEQNAFRLRMAQIREETLKREIRNEGHPVYDDISEVMRPKFGFVTYDGKKIRKLPTATQRLVAEAYRYSLEKEWLYDKFPDVS